MTVAAAIGGMVGALMFGMTVGYGLGRPNIRRHPFPVPCMAVERFPDAVGAELGSGWAAALPDGYVPAAGQRLCGHPKGHTGRHSWEA